MIYVEYEIKGRLQVPDGSKFSDKQDNLIVLPHGGVISVHPVVELSSSIDADDHVNLNYDHCRSLGIELLDYEREMDESIFDSDCSHPDEVLAPINKKVLEAQGIALKPWVHPKCWVPANVPPIFNEPTE